MLKAFVTLPTFVFLAAWTTAILPQTAGDFSQIPSKYHRVSLPMEQIERKLKGSSGTKPVIDVPTPKGEMQAFVVSESPVVQPALLERYPTLRTYSGVAVDDPRTIIRFDLMNGEFHGLVSGQGGDFMVTAFPGGRKGEHMSYFVADMPHRKGEFICGTHAPKDNFEPKMDLLGVPTTIGGTLRTYTLAVSTHHTWTEEIGGNSVASGLAFVVRMVNLMNLFFERDAAVTFVLHENNDQVIFLGNNQYPAANDPESMLVVNTSILNSRLGTNSYDVGHAFSSQPSSAVVGIAQAGSACSAVRGAGVSWVREEGGFDLHTFAHEVGHQLNALHAFNANDPNRSDISAYEPSFGRTLMSYPDIAQLVPYFHIRSIEEMHSFTLSASCVENTPTANTPPSVTAPSSVTIPKLTPFSLTASASDIDGDLLTYQWQQFDLGQPDPPFGDSDGNVRPLFRVFEPATDPTRFFPALEHILLSSNQPPTQSHEVLPSITRTMRFRLAVRDNRPLSGGVTIGDTFVTVDGGSGPFTVTSQNSNAAFQVNSQMAVTWDVANTNNAPVSAANVDILLSTDGGQTFPTQLASAVANDGSELVTLPNVISNTARVMVRATGNIFFDVNDQNFGIQDCVAGACPPLLLTPAAVTIPRGTGVQLTSSGGVGGHSYSLVRNDSGGSLNLITAFHQTGPSVGIDIVRVTDSVGNSADAVITTQAPCVSGEKTWDGEGSTANWSEGANWTCDQVPLQNELVVFDVTSKKNAVIDADTTAASIDQRFSYLPGELSIPTGVTLTVLGDLTSNSDLVGAGTLVLHGDFSKGSGNFFPTPEIRLVGDQNSIFQGEAFNLFVDTTAVKEFTGGTIGGTLNLVRGGITGTVSAANLDIAATYADAAGIPANITLLGPDGTYINRGGTTPRGNWTTQNQTTLLSDLDLSNGTGQLTLNGLILGNGFLTNAGTRNVSGSSHVVGELRRVITSTGATEFRVGSFSATGSPATINVLTLGPGTNAVTARYSVGNPPGMNPATSLVCYWELEREGSITAALTFSYPSGCDPNTIENTATPARIVGGNPTFVPGTVNATANTFTIFHVADLDAAYSMGVNPSPCDPSPRSWDGEGASNNWSEAANWNCDSVPVFGAEVVFDGTSPKNVDVDVPIVVQSLTTNAGYTGTVAFGVSDATIGSITLNSGAIAGGSGLAAVSGITTHTNGTLAGGTGQMTFNGSYTMSGGSVVGGQGTMSFVNNFNHSAGAFSASSGPLNFGGYRISGTGSFTGSGGAIEIGTLTVQGGSFNCGTSPLSLINYTQTGGSFTATSQTLAITGSYRRTAGTFAPNSGTIEFRGSVSQLNIGVAASHVETFNNVVLNKLETDSSLAVTGIVNVTGNLTALKGRFSQQGATAARIDLHGNLAMSADSSGLMTLRQIGSGDQTIDAPAVPSFASTWVVDKPSGKVNLLADLTHLGNTELVSGVVDSGEFVLRLAPDYFGFDDAGYVIGNLRKQVVDAATFEVGDPAGRALLYLQLATSDPTDVTVRHEPTALAGTNPAVSLTSNWHIDSGGVDALALLFLYSDSHVPAGADENSFKFIRRSGGVNTAFEPTAFDIDANEFYLESPTPFPLSDWTLGNLIPTAASTTVSGRVTDGLGRGISGAIISLTGSSGESRSVLTGTFGYFFFGEVESGATYVISARHRRYKFHDPTRLIDVSDAVSGIHFVGRP